MDPGMMTFFTQPVNFTVPQTGAARIVSDRYLKTRVDAQTVSIALGAQPVDAYFVVTRGATSVNTWTVNTDNTDTSYYLEEVGGFQYTLHHDSIIPDPLEIAVVGGSIYRVMVMLSLYTVNVNKFFYQMDPRHEDRTGVVHASMDGNNSLQRRARSSLKRRLSLGSRYRDKSESDILKQLMEDYPQFTFSRGSKIYYADVYPSYWDTEIQTPPTNWNPAEQDIVFTIIEQ